MNIRVDCHFPLQGIFSTQGVKLCPFIGRCFVVVVVVVVVFTTELPGKPLSISSECLLSDRKYTRCLSAKILKVPKIPVSPILTSFPSVWSHYLSLCIW